MRGGRERREKGRGGEGGEGGEVVEGLVEIKRGDGQVGEGEREVVHGSL